MGRITGVKLKKVLDKKKGQVIKSFHPAFRSFDIITMPKDAVKRSRKDSTSSDASGPAKKSSKSSGSSGGASKNSGGVSKNSGSSSGGRPCAIPGDTSGEPSWALGSMKFVKVREFKGKTYIDIREHYVDQKTMDTRPGKKGISLNCEQYQTLKSLLDEVDRNLP